MVQRQVMLPWNLRSPQEFDEQRREVEEAYPHLHFFVDADGVQIRGAFPLVHEGNVLDRYSIEVKIPDNYPIDMPIVKEVSGRIAWSMNDHINGDGSICLFVSDERWRHFPPGARLIDFLNGPVRNFFLGLSLRRLGAEWPFGERSHGADGILESYYELLDTTETQVVRAYLHYLSKKVIKGHWSCPCGSGKKLRNCHISVFEDVRKKIPPSIAQAALERLRDIK
jgi:SEC-C motif